VKIVGLEGITPGQLHVELQGGARFVIFQYCISILVLSFKRSSDIHYIRPDDNAFAKGLPYSFGSFLVGWWGFPWGPIWTVGTIVTNCRGGRNVTQEVLRSLNAGASAPAPDAK
jgi:hypothetical protein